MKRSFKTLVIAAQLIVLVGADIFTAFIMYPRAWALREPGWWLFDTPVTRTLASTPHNQWIVIASLPVALQLFRLYRLDRVALRQIVLFVPIAMVVHMVAMAQYFTWTI